MKVLHEEAHEAVQAFGVPAEMESLEPGVGSEWKARAAKLEGDLRLLRWMAGMAIVLAATVLFRVFTH